MASVRDTVTGKVYSVGIIGYGMSAKTFHIPFLKLTLSLKLAAILQRTPTEGNSAPHDYPNLKHYTDFDSFINEPSLDVVLVLTPPNTHFEFARKALEQGKHVLVEKPFVPTSAEGAQLTQLARERQRVLCVYQNRRWDADFLTVQKLLREDKLGRLVEFETHFDRFKPEKPATWKGTLGMAQGGGVIYDLGTHLIDQVYTLFGLPSTVYGKFVNQRDGKLLSGDDEPDSVTAQLGYARTGLLVFVRMGVMSVESQQPRYWVRGTKGSYRKLGVDAQEDQLKKGLSPAAQGFGVEGSEWHGRLAVANADGSATEEVCPTVEPETYAKFYDLFAKAVAGGSEADVPVPSAEAVDVLKIIEAVTESAKTGKEVSLS